jgi:hypothetical protein
MMLALLNWCITSVVKLHPTSLNLVPLPTASSSTFLAGIYGLPRNGNDLTLSRSKKALACLVLPRLVPRCCAPIGLTSLSRVELVKLACAVMDLSAPLQSFLSPKRMPRASISHACVFNLSAAMGFVVMGAGCTNAYANSPSPTQATYVRTDDAYADWNRYHSRHGKEVACSLVFPVQKAVQGHPHCGKSTSTRFSTTSISCTRHTSERDVYLGKIDGKLVLLCRQVDDLAVACSDLSVAQGLIDSIGKIVNVKS